MLAPVRERSIHRPTSAAVQGGPRNANRPMWTEVADSPDRVTRHGTTDARRRSPAPSTPLSDGSARLRLSSRLACRIRCRSLLSQPEASCRAFGARRFRLRPTRQWPCQVCANPRRGGKQLEMQGLRKRVRCGICFVRDTVSLPRVRFRRASMTRLTVFHTSSAKRARACWVGLAANLRQSAPARGVRGNTEQTNLSQV